MHTTISSEHRPGYRPFTLTLGCVTPHDTPEARYQPRPQLGVVDGLVSVTQRAWGLPGKTERDVCALVKP
jgi:hypothetical protein